MDPIQQYIVDLENKAQSNIITELHAFLSTYPSLKAKMRYKIPFYDQRKWICYLNPVKPNAVELVFLKGPALSNKQGLLESRNRKMVMGILIHHSSSIPFEAIDEIIQEALALDPL
jgi:hypothetical protein